MKILSLNIQPNQQDSRHIHFFFSYIFIIDYCMYFVRTEQGWPYTRILLYDALYKHWIKNASHLSLLLFFKGRGRKTCLFRNVWCFLCHATVSCLGLWQSGSSAHAMLQLNCCLFQEKGTSAMLQCSLVSGRSGGSWILIPAHLWLELGHASPSHQKPLLTTEIRGTLLCLFSLWIQNPALLLNYYNFGQLF